MNTTNPLSNFTFPVTDGHAVYFADDYMSIVRDHTDGDPYVKGDADSGFVIYVRQQAYHPAIGCGETEELAWMDAAAEILNNNNGQGYANLDSWDDLKSAREALADYADDDESKYREHFSQVIAMLEASIANREVASK